VLDVVSDVRDRIRVSTAELIYERSKGLPADLQEQVLDFVESLGQSKDRLRDEWTSLSLATALRGMEEDSWPAYPDAELVEDWR
jgi:hypothetical protein